MRKVLKRANGDIWDPDCSCHNECHGKSLNTYMMPSTKGEIAPSLWHMDSLQGLESITFLPIGKAYSVCDFHN